jgi:CRISPR-associated endonuclease/helicase Cas3
VSYGELAPQLAERALRVADGIARGGFAAHALDDDFIRLLHRQLCGDLVPAIAGRWRDRAVTVGDHEPPPPYAVATAMRDFAQDLNERLKHVEDSPERLLETLAFAERRLLYIHPFVDFNGRVTRLFLAELLRRLDLPAVDLAPEDGAPREAYLFALRAADARDLAPLRAIWQERLARG